MVFNPYASQTVTPAISGSGNVTKLGPGTTYLNGSNSYSGGTTISAGVLDIAGGAWLPGWITPGGFVVTAGGALAVPDAVTDANIATLLTTGNFAAGAAIGFDTSSGSRTYNPVLADTAAGALGLVKAGSSSLTLTAVNTYSGGTTIANAGSAAPGKRTSFWPTRPDKPSKATSSLAMASPASPRCRCRPRTNSPPTRSSRSMTPTPTGPT